MNYAVPRILDQVGKLEHFFTDLCAVKGCLRLLNLLPSSLRHGGVQRLLDRVPRDVAPRKITSFGSLGLRYAWRRRVAKAPGELTKAYLWCGREFCRRVNVNPWGGAEA